MSDAKTLALRLLLAALSVVTGLGCGTSAEHSPAPQQQARQFDEAPQRGSDAWLIEQASRYLGDDRFRRRMLEASLTNRDNIYSRSRLASYALPRGGWDALPEWNPRVRPVDASVVGQLRGGGAPRVTAGHPPLWDGQVPETMPDWIALGRRVFFEYPLRPEVFARHALADPTLAAQVGLTATDDGVWPGVVAFRDVDSSTRIGITCALCHTAVRGGQLVAGRARRELDYGLMRLAYHRDTGAPLPTALADRMQRWGPGRADITEDDDEDPVAIVDLWGVRSHAYLTQSGTLRHVHPAALAIRQETQILHANRERTRPPRALAWALAMYVYSLQPPAKPRVATTAKSKSLLATGRRLFAAHCASCHSDVNGGGMPVAASVVGTDDTLARGHARGTGLYRPSPLTAVADAAPYLHHGVVKDLEALLDQRRLAADYDQGARGPGPVPGHRYGTGLAAADRVALVAYLRTL